MAANRIHHQGKMEKNVLRFTIYIYIYILDSFSIGAFLYFPVFLWMHAHNTGQHCLTFFSPSSTLIYLRTTLGLYLGVSPVGQLGGGIRDAAVTHLKHSQKVKYFWLTVCVV